MSLSDLLFLLLVLATVVSGFVFVIKLVRTRASSAARWVAICAAAWAVYLGVGWAVAVATPQRVLPLSQARCFDEMCFRIAGIQRQGDHWTIAIETSNRGRGRMQRESGAQAFLVDGNGRRYSALRQSGPGLDAPLVAGETVTTELVFPAPLQENGAGLVVSHSYALNPARIIVGDDQHFGHSPTMIALNGR